MEKNRVDGLRRKSGIIIISRDAWRYHIFPMLLLEEIVRLDTAITNHEARYLHLDALNGLHLESAIGISTVSCAQWIISKGIRLFDVEIQCRDAEKICRALFKANPGIKKINLMMGSFRSPVVKLIAKYLHSITHIEHKRVQELFRGHSNKLTDECILLLSQSCPSLTHLNISRCDRITDASITMLSRSCRELSHLCLWDCTAITDVSIIALSVGCPGLKYLDLWGCKNISDASVIELSRRCNSLVHLDLAYCNLLTDAAIGALFRNCPYLVYLNVDYTLKPRLSKETIAILSLYQNRISNIRYIY